MRRVHIALDGVDATAVLHDVDAPQTTEKFWRALPVSGTLRHVRWSGKAGYLMEHSLGGEDGDHPENAVSSYPPGSLVLRTDHGELAFAYGEAQARDDKRLAARGCHLASVDSNAEAFFAKVASTMHEGGKPIRIDKGDES